MSDVEALKKSNAERLQKLSRDGVGVDTQGLALTVLIDQLTPAKRKAFEETFERELDEILAQVEQQVTRAKLGVSGNMSLASVNRDKPLGG